PSGRCNRPMTWACFDPAREPDAPGAVGSVSTGKFANAAQRRRAAVLRSLNLDNLFAPGSAFQIATIRAADNPLPSTFSTDLTRTSSSDIAGAEANAVTMRPRIT